MSVSFGGTSTSQTNFVVAPVATVANSRATYVGNGSTQQYTIPFPYLLPAHVWVLINGVPIAFPQWEFLTPTLITLGSAPVNGVLIEIRRVTPLNPLVTYTDGAVLPAADLNLATLQNLYLLQEFNDLYMNSLNGALSTISSYGGVLSVNPQQLIDQVASQVLGSALVTSLSQRISDIDDSAEAILNNAITDSNFQTQINTMYVNNGSTAAAITTEATVRNAADSALASQITALTATGGAVTAAIAVESTARISGDSANATSISTLSTTVAGNTSSIATQATSINGLSAQYTVKVDVNGRVSGYGLASTATTAGALSSFVVIANQFSVVDPGSTGSAPIVPFSISGGVVYMQNVVIASALIQSLVVDKLIAGSLTAAVVQNADWNAGTGRIIWDNGTYMKVIGVGFGSASQFIEWYGPHQASFATCTELNAISYQKTNGLTYAKGISSPSGNIYQSVGTTPVVGSLVAYGAPAIATYPLISNGRTITVQVAFENNAVAGTCTTASPLNTTATITFNLYRTIGAGAETLWQTWTVTPSINSVGPTPYSVSMVQVPATTWTYSDTSATAQTHSYRLATSFTPPAGYSTITWGVGVGNTPFIAQCVLSQSEPDH